MGINTTVYVIKPLADRAVDTSGILKGLHISAVVEQDDLAFNSALGILWQQPPSGMIAIAVYRGSVIFIDDGQRIDTDPIPQFTAAYPAEVLRVGNSDSTGTGDFLFWRDGALVRKVSIGAKEWMDEMGITDEEIISRFEPFTIGHSQEFEKEFVTPLNVLAAYSLDYIDFYNLRWSIYRLT